MSSSITASTLTTSPHHRIFIPNLAGRQMITLNLISETSGGEDDSTLDLLHFEDAGYASSSSASSSSSEDEEEPALSASTSRSASPAPSVASSASSGMSRRVRRGGFIPADAF